MATTDFRNADGEHIPCRLCLNDHLSSEPCDGTANPAECVTGMTTPDECAMARERATAGLGIPGMEVCPVHDTDEALRG